VEKGSLAYSFAAAFAGKVLGLSFSVRKYEEEIHNPLQFSSIQISFLIFCWAKEVMQE
jgi:uncharacterized membrane protein